MCHIQYKVLCKHLFNFYKTLGRQKLFLILYTLLNIRQFNTKKVVLNLVSEPSLLTQAYNNHPIRRPWQEIIRLKPVKLQSKLKGSLSNFVKVRNYLKREKEKREGQGIDFHGRPFSSICKDLGLIPGKYQYHKTMYHFDF